MIHTVAKLFMPPPKKPSKKFTWDPGLSYIIGLIVTDGHLSKDGRHIVMKSSDYQNLENFNRCLGRNYKIRLAKEKREDWNRKPHYKIQFGDVQLYRWLLSIGVCQQKTHNIGAIKIPDKYFPDFLRGHLDGDGTITGYTDYSNARKNPKYVYTRIWLKFGLVSKKHLEWLQSKLYEIAGVKGHLNMSSQKPGQNRKNRWVLKFGKQDSVALLNWIYYDPNLPCLERKRKKAEKLLEKENRHLEKYPARNRGRPRIMAK